jgi:hypothetical protein
MVVRLGVGLAKFLAGALLSILVFLTGAFFQVRGALPAYNSHVEAPLSGWATCTPRTASGRWS